MKDLCFDNNSFINIQNGGAAGGAIVARKGQKHDPKTSFLS